MVIICLLTYFAPNSFAPIFICGHHKFWVVFFSAVLPAVDVGCCRLYLLFFNYDMHIFFYVQR